MPALLTRAIHTWQTVSVLERVSLLGMLACVSANFAFTSQFHEYWRDETQTMLIARAEGLGTLWHMLRIEGVPPIVYLAMKLCDVLPAPYSLAAFGAFGLAVLMLGCHVLVFALTRRHALALATALAFGATDTFFYELGVVVRQYGLGLGFALGCIGFLHTSLEAASRRAQWAGAACGALAVLTSAHSGCVAGGALLAFGALQLVRARSLRAVSPALSALPAFLLTFYIISPYALRTPEMLEPLTLTPDEKWRDAKLVLEHSVFPGAWWGHARSQAAERWMLVAIVTVGLVTACSAALRALVRPRFRAIALYYGMALSFSFAALMYIFLERNGGAYRHHLFLFVPGFVVAVGATLRRLYQAGSSRTLAALCALALIPWFGYQYYVCAFDLISDERERFSQTKEQALVFPQGAHVVASGGMELTGMLYWRPDLTLRSLDGRGRRLRYMYPDIHWHTRARLEPLLEEECAEAPDSTFLARDPAGETVSARVTACLDQVSPQQPSRLKESFDVARLDCRCLRKSGS
jgi:hypothetical protein